MLHLDTVLVVLATYLLAGRIKVQKDFAASVMDRPAYVDRGGPAARVMAWLLWPRHQSFLDGLALIITSFLFVELVGLVIGLFTSEDIIRFGVPLVLVVASFVPYLSARASDGGVRLNIRGD